MVIVVRKEFKGAIVTKKPRKVETNQWATSTNNPHSTIGSGCLVEMVVEILKS
jgi:hypothetical protein